MSGERFVRVPVGPDAERWTTVGGCKLVLGVTRTVTSANRLIEALEVFRGDFRVQVVFAVDGTSPFVDGVEATLRSAGARIIPWAQVPAVRADLVLAATENADLDAVNGPIVVLPHGVGFHKYVPDAATEGVRISGVVPRQRPAAPTMVVSHTDQADQLRQVAAGTSARVIGDPALERMIASGRMAGAYRRSLGLGDRQRLVVLTSTWGAGALWGVAPGLPRALTEALPYDEFRLALILHPNVWFGHSPWQVRTWLAEAQDAGLALLPPTAGWQATVTAADVVVGDHGSVTLYAAALGKPVLLAAFGDEVVPGTAMAYLGSAAARMDPGGDLRAQIEEAKPVPGAGERAFTGPAGSTRRLRALFYDRLGLPAPERPAGVRVWPCPSPERREATSFVVFADVSDPGTVTVRRYAPGHSGEETGTLLRHRASFDDEPDADAAANASVVVARTGGDAAELLRRHPGAVCAAADDLVVLRNGPAVRVAADAGADPMCVAAVIYSLWRTRQPLTGTVILRTGSLRISLTLAAA